MAKEIFETPQKREIMRERFEFELTVNGNMICQRYFKINNFRERSIYSVDFYDTVQACAKLIQDDLRDKTQAYVEHMAPLVFRDIEEMEKWFYNDDGSVNENNANYAGYGRHILLRSPNGHEYVWADKLVDEGPRKTENYNEFIDKPNEDQSTMFKFSVYDNGRYWKETPIRKEVGSVTWDGSVYPAFVRNGVDLTNGRGRYDDFDITNKSHEMCLYYWCNAHKPDLIQLITRELREVCSYEEDGEYETTMTYGSVVYNNVPDFPGPQPEYPYKK